MVKYLTHKEMRARLKQIKLINSGAKVLGLDIGRRWTGLSVSDPQLIVAKPLKTVELKTNMLGVDGDMASVCRVIRNVVGSKQIKGLVVGYPLDEQGQPTKHCEFIQDFLYTLHAMTGLKTPVTLVNEYGSSQSAKV